MFIFTTLLGFFFLAIFVNSFIQKITFLDFKRPVFNAPLPILLKLFIFVIFIAWSGTSVIQAQTCSVNAGVTQTLCPNDTIRLQGVISGDIVPGSLKWTQVSGPLADILNPGDITTTAGLAVNGATYSFNISALCSEDGQPTDQSVTFYVLDIKPVLGSDVTLNGCVNVTQSIAVDFTASNFDYFSYNQISGPTTSMGSISYNNATKKLTFNLGSNCNLAGPLVYQIIASNYSSTCRIANYDTAYITISTPYRPPVPDVYNASTSCSPFVSFYDNCPAPGGQGTWTSVVAPAGFEFTPTIGNGTLTTIVNPTFQGNEYYVFRYEIAATTCSPALNQTFGVTSSYNSSCGSGGGGGTTCVSQYPTIYTSDQTYCNTTITNSNPWVLPLLGSVPNPSMDYTWTVSTSPGINTTILNPNSLSTSLYYSNITGEGTFNITVFLKSIDSCNRVVSDYLYITIINKENSSKHYEVNCGSSFRDLSQYGCAVTGAFNFQIFDSPVASAGADIISCGPITNPVLGPAQNLYAGQFPNSFSWTPVLNLSDPISTSPTYNGVISTTTTFQVEVTNRFGCTDTDEMQVIISAVPSCVATDLDSQPLTSIELCLGESIEFVVDCPNGTPELDNPPLGNLTFNRNTGHWTFESTGGGSGNIVFTYPDPDGTGGCPEGSLVIPVTVQNLPFLACGDDIVICDDMPLQTNISAPLNDVTFHWTLFSNISKCHYD